MEGGEQREDRGVEVSADGCERVEGYEREGCDSERQSAVRGWRTLPRRTAVRDGEDKGLRKTVQECERVDASTRTNNPKKTEWRRRCASARWVSERVEGSEKAGSAEGCDGRQ